MWKKIAISSIALWAISLSFVGYRFYYGNAKTVDKRIEVSLADEERELVLGEMRTLLKGLKGIIKGLANDDYTFVERSARSNGMEMAQDVNPALMMKLPKAFKSLGISVHEDFDILANNIHSMNSKQILMALDKTMGKCVSCHQAYKVTLEEK